MDKQASSFKLGCMTWPGVFLAVAIIAIRAFQPNAQAIETWSALSWCLMLLPAFLPVISWIVFFAIWLAGIILSAFTKS